MKEVKCALCAKIFKLKDTQVVDEALGCITNQLLRQDPKECNSKKKKRGKQSDK